VAIQSFANIQIERFFRLGHIGKKVGWQDIKTIVMRKLDMLDYASALQDLASPPGNRLEKLKGKMKDFHSIRINEQWRLVFRWTEAGPEDVDVLDYH
jgi:proteic killer suppression protein